MKTSRTHEFSTRTAAAYAADWELFSDWCAATERASLPTDPATVLSFLQACPAATATLRRRVAAIDHHHTSVGATPPGTHPAVRDALGRPTPPDNGDTAACLDVRLRLLPSHGWTGGLFGRRDRVLLTLSAAGVRAAQLATATAADLTVDGGTATFTRDPAADDGAVTLRATTDPQVCGPCACARWLRLLNLIADSASHRRWRDALHAAAPVTDTSPHACRRHTAASAGGAVFPLLPRIDQWGYLDLSPQPVGPRSLHRLSTRLMSDQSAPARRQFPLAPTEPDPRAPDDSPSPVPVSAPFGADELAAGLERRRWQKDRTAEIDELLDDLEVRVAAALAGSVASPAS